MDKQGWINKYIIFKADGSPIDEAAKYFVLRIDKDPHAREALYAYAHSVVKDNPALASDIMDILELYGFKPHLPTYNPSYSHGDHTIRVFLQFEDYHGWVDTMLGGNCKGIEIVQNDVVDDIMIGNTEPPSNCKFHVEVSEDGEEAIGWSAELINDRGELLEIDGDYDDLGIYIVGIQIINFEPEDRQYGSLT